MVDHEEFSRCIDVSTFNLFHGKVFVFWNWNVADLEEMTEEESNSNCSDDQGDDRHDNDELVEVDSEAACDESRSVSANVLNSVCFKCIGRTKEQSYLDILAEAVQKKRAGINVEVRLSPEPHNPFDANAIVF